MEQPAGLLTRMAIAWDAYEQEARKQKAIDEFETVQAQNKTAWIKANPDLWTEWVRQNGIKEQMAAWREKQRQKRAISG